MKAFLTKVDLKGKNIYSFWTYYDHDEKVYEDFKKINDNWRIIKGLPLTMSDVNNPSKLNVLLNNLYLKIK